MKNTAIFIPTYRRADRLAQVRENALQSAPDQVNVYFIIERTDEASHAVLASLRANIIFNKGKPNYADAINTAYHHTDEPYFFCGADDLDFRPGWLAIAMTKMVDPIRVVGTNDLHNGEVLAGEHATHYLIDRRYIQEESGVADQPDTVLSNGYFHNWTDREFIALAQKRGRFAPCLESIVEHRHWGWGLNVKDATYEKQDGHWDEDARLYNERRAVFGF